MMATLLICMVQGLKGDDGSMGVVVDEDFDTCLNKKAPLQGTSSALEARQQAMYHQANGRGEIYLEPHAIVAIVANWEDE